MVTMTGGGVVLINAFDVPAGEDDVFLQGWERERDFLMAQNGYRSSQLRQSSGASADSHYVNVTTWDSEEALRAATAGPEFRTASAPLDPYASLYEVVRADVHWQPLTVAA